MAYIGLPPKANFTSGLLDRFTSTTGTTVTLTHDISSENDIVVFVNFVKQDSTTYSVGGTGNKTLTLGGTLVSSDIVEVHYLNIVGQTVAPSSGSVGSSQLTADVITGQTALAVAPDSTDELLISDGGTLKRIDVSLVGGTNTPAFYATNGTTDQSLASGTQTKINFGTEILDSDSAFASSRFTCPSGSAGKYYLFASVDMLEDDSDMTSHNLYFFKNGSAVISHVFNNTSASVIRRISTYFGGVLDLSASDYVEIYFQFVGNSGDAGDVKGSGGATFFGGYKIIE